MTTEIRVKASQYASVANGQDGFPVDVRGTRDGSISVVDFLNLKNLEGKVFTVNIGALSTPIAGDGTILDQDRPVGLISIPTGYAIMLNRVSAQCQTPLIATDADESEILLAVDRSAAWDGTGTATAETAIPLRTDNKRVSACTCKSAFTADITTVPVLGIELARKVITADILLASTPTNALWGKLALDYEPMVKPIIVGPAMVCLYWGGTVATTGFAQIEWAEYLTTDFT
jgi:hypothetical protein